MRKRKLFRKTGSDVIDDLPCKQMASAGAAIWLPGTETFFMESSTMIARAQQQRNATAAQFDSSEFFVRRLEEYERT